MDNFGILYLDPHENFCGSEILPPLPMFVYIFLKVLD